MDLIIAPTPGWRLRLNVSWVLTETLFPIFCEAADADPTKFMRSLYTQKLKRLCAKPQQYTWHTPFNGLEFPSPSPFWSLLPESKWGLFICLHYLVYFLLCPISNRWNVAQRHNRDTANSWEQIRVECRQGEITLRLHTRQICALAIAMKYLVKAVKERIRERKQRHIISVSPEEHRRWTGTMRQAEQKVHMETVNTLLVEKNPELDGLQDCQEQRVFTKTLVRKHQCVLLGFHISVADVYLNPGP